MIKPEKISRDEIDEQIVGEGPDRYVCDDCGNGFDKLQDGSPCCKSSYTTLTGEENNAN